MANISSYILETTLYISVFYLFSFLYIKRTKFFRFNRIMLLVGTILSFALPFAEFSFVEIEPIYEMQYNFSEFFASETYDTATINEGVGFSTFPFAIYLIGVCICFVKTFVSAARIWRIINSSCREFIDGVTVYVTSMKNVSFSCGKYIVISKDLLDESEIIIMHEKMHTRCRHSIDIVISQFVVAFQWFNPVVWIAAAELKLLHEYEADDMMLDAGISASKYQLLLVKKAVGPERFQLANSFNHSKLKRRIGMMTRETSNRWVRAFYLVSLPLLVFIAGCHNTDLIIDNDDSPTVHQIAVVSFLSNGNVKVPSVQQKSLRKSVQNDRIIKDMNDFTRWAFSKIVYPASCDADGEVLVSFIVGTDGVVKRIKVEKSVHKLLDNEVVSLVASSPKWIPAVIDGKKVCKKYMFSVKFIKN